MKSFGHAAVAVYVAVVLHVLCEVLTPVSAEDVWPDQDLVNTVTKSSDSSKDAFKTAMQAELMHLARTGPGFDDESDDPADWKASTMVRDLFQETTQKTLYTLMDELNLFEENTR
eukprot:g1956.t1